MQRKFGPLIVISLGLILFLAYVVLQRDSPESGASQPAPIARTPPKADETAFATAAPSTVPTHAPTIVATSPDPTVTPTQTPQPIFPTTTASANEIVTAEATTSTAPFTTTARCPLPDCLARSGVSGRLEDVTAAAGAGLPFGNYFNWWSEAAPPLTGGLAGGDMVEFWQMVPVTQDGPAVPWSKIEQVVAMQPGAVWIIGNEPDVIWQDNTTAEAYAAIYHDLYTFIKERDPSARIAIAGVAQPSPLRLAYLEKVLETYQELYGGPMPVDIWTVHAFILREQRDSWGVGIPPGMEETSGLLYEIEDHDDLNIFGQSLVAFRRWMAQNGYGGYPLAVTEFGILHPSDYGFPPEAVMTFMLGALDIMASAGDDTGDPADNYRLVQNWFWYSVYDDGDFPTGNLYDARQGELTVIGRAYRDYLRDE